jgi:methyl-accepting chemotaxis protein
MKTRTSISRAVRVLFIVNGLCIATVLAAFAAYGWAAHSLQTANTAQYRSYLLADELRQSSDDLTRMARGFAATGDAHYERQYLDVVAMRAGEKARPESPHRIYWDLVGADDRRPRPDGKTLGLLDEMRQFGFTEKEFEHLELATQRSNALIELETQAMNAVHGRFKDAAGGYSITGAPNLQLARGLLFSSDYAEAKRQVMVPVDQFFGLMEARTAGAVASADRWALIAMSVLIAALALLVASLGTTGVILMRRVMRPLGAIRGSMETLANGELDAAIPYADQSDEIGDMAQALMVFRDNAAARLAADAQAIKAREQAELEKQAASEAAIREQQTLVVESFGVALARLADGELSYRLDCDLPPEYIQLRDNFNSAMASLQQAMSLVVSNAGGIRSGSNEISQAADDLSRRTEQQAASLEETAAALDEITATVNKTASGARQASGVVQQARGDAETSGNVVRDAVAAMSAIEQSAQQISQIIGVIDEIAFQTNLLALNAGVEAARAGDAGRGFAVVASEVRALAQRSAEAAKEIKTLISASTTQVDSGVKLVGQTGEALQRIVGRVAEIDGLVSEIAASAQEQATGLQQVNTAVNQMDQVTQQNAAMVEESTAASHSLSQEAETLQASVSRFNIGQPAPAAAAPRAPRHQPVAALRTVGRGGAALNPQPVAAEEGWEEF